MTNKREIAQVLHEIAFFLRLHGDNAYKARAYDKAATALLNASHDAQALVNKRMLTDVPDIGPATAAVITELVHTGNSVLHQELKKDFPSSLSELGDVPGLSVKQILRLYQRADVRSLEDLRRACRENRLVAVSGFGTKFQAKLLASLGGYERGHGYHLYANVLVEVEHLKSALEKLPGVQAVTVAGALRRKLEVIDELTFVLTVVRSTPPESLLRTINALSNVTDVGLDGDAIIARSPNDIPIRLKLTLPERYACDLWHATGNPDHIAAVHLRLAEKGFKTSEDLYASTKGVEIGEEDIYLRAGLPFIPPELREGRGELELAESDGMLPLVDTTQIQGCFHLHTNFTDGADTVEAMVRAARSRGYRYIGISDHSQSAFYVNGLKEDRITAQWQEIDDIQRKYPDIHIFKGIEADILPDGAMDYSDDLLAQFDFVIASVHSRFNLSEDDQTRRICRALANRYVTMLGHPTGRLLLSRPGYRVDLTEVIKAVAANGKIIEINGSRYRLDLDWRWARLAKTHGVRFCVSPDAHAVDEFRNVALGVNVARKAGLGRQDIVNTYPLSDIRTVLHAARRDR